jgi:hypothetical protein
MGEFARVLFTATDPEGRDVRLVRLRRGGWGIAVDGRCQVQTWANGELKAAVLEYRRQIGLADGSENPREFVRVAQAEWIVAAPEFGTM